MSEPDQSPQPGSAPVPGPARPAPHMMPRSAGGSAGPGSGEDTSPEVVTENVAAVLADVDAIRQETGDTFDIAALTRQTELLERAHDTLTSALEDVDPR
ncbi:hypothetical protein ACWDTI_15805 [Gordonia sp. NPDC003424]